MPTYKHTVSFTVESSNKFEYWTSGLKRLSGPIMGNLFIPEDAVIRTEEVKTPHFKVKDKVCSWGNNREAFEVVSEPFKSNFEGEEEYKYVLKSSTGYIFMEVESGLAPIQD